MPTATAHVLIVDDEPDIRALVEIALNRMGGVVTHAAATLAEARALLQQQRFDVCITDMRLPDGNGIHLIADIQRIAPQTPVAVITAYGNAEAAVESLKAGAFDFVSKPVDVKVLRKLVDTALKLQQPAAHANLSVPDSADDPLLGEHASMVQLRSLIERLARSQAPVHISGESGTGKELVAQRIHQCGPRANAPFVAINCGAIPAELMESEFFGHLKGSFTGAHRDHPGLFQAAEGGTLMLDEVAELPLHMQVKLLRALQERRVRPVGSQHEVAVNVRIISATHEDLAARVQTGDFRQDLFYRLDVIAVRTPPLRERVSDIPLLATHILARLAADAGIAAPPTLSDEALDTLRNYAFPGNVRELENILERALTLSDGPVIDHDDLQLRSVTRAAIPAHSSPNDPPAAHALDAHIAAALKTWRDLADASDAELNQLAQRVGCSPRALRYRLHKLGLRPAH